MFIDIHVHTRRAKGFPREWDGATYASPDELITVFDAVGIDKAVVLPAASPECCHVPQSLETFLETLAAYDRFIPFCNCDPRFLKNSPDAPLAEFLAFYKEKGCRGVGEVTANMYFDDPMVEIGPTARAVVGFLPRFGTAAVVRREYISGQHHRLSRLGPAPRTGGSARASRFFGGRWAPR